MLENPSTASSEDFERVARVGPKGALCLCATAVSVVVLIWLAFYFFTFLPRGMLR
jgi:hypothetical protein